MAAIVSGTEAAVLRLLEDWRLPEVSRSGAPGAPRVPQALGVEGSPEAWLLAGAPWNMAEVPLISSGFGK